MYQGKDIYSNPYLVRDTTVIGIQGVIGVWDLASDL